MEYESLYMNKKRMGKFNSYARNSFFRREKLSVLEVADGIVLPAKRDEREIPNIWAVGGVIDSDGNFVKESITGSKDRPLFGGSYEFNEDFVTYYDEEVVFMGPFIKHWGHFICDQISRLWYVIDNPKKYKIVYCGWDWDNGLGYIDGNYFELFELLGIDREQLINIQRPTKFKKVIIPEFSFIPNNYYSKEYVRLTDIIVNNVKLEIDNCPEKVYFTRLMLESAINKERGEPKIIEYLKEKGYVVLSPEKLSLSEQIYYLNNCKNICMVSGSISHNLMFDKSNNHAIILNKFDMINDYQVLVDHITVANISYIDVYKKIFSVLFGMGPFLIYVNHYLEKWGGKYKVKNGRLSIKDYFWYFKRYFITYRDKNNRRILKEQPKL